MNDSGLVSIDEVEKPVTVGIMCTSDGSSLPCYMVHYKAEHPKLTDLFWRFKKIELEVMNSDLGGYFFSVTSDRKIFSVDDEEAIKNLPLEKQALVKKIKRFIGEGVPEFQSSFMVDQDVGSQFNDCRLKCNGNWVLVALASEATLIFVNKEGLIVGRSELPRDFFKFLSALG